jgi:fatty acid synthase subunit alpha
MEQNNITAPGIEEMGVRTFSRFEMAFCLLTLLQSEVVEMAQLKPMFGILYFIISKNNNSV